MFEDEVSDHFWGVCFVLFLAKISVLDQLQLICMYIQLFVQCNFNCSWQLNMNAFMFYTVEGDFRLINTAT